MSRSFDDFRRERDEGQARLIASVDALIAERDEVAS